MSTKPQEKKQEDLRVKMEILDQQYRDVFSSPDGQAVLLDLVNRFSLMGRVFIPSANDGLANPLHAALRDGERAAVNYIISRAQRADPDFNIPFPKPSQKGRKKPTKIEQE